MNIVKHLTCAFELKNIQWLVSADNSSCTGVRSYKKRLIWDRKKEMEIGSVLSYEHNKLHFLFTFPGFGGRDDRRFLVLLFMEKKIKECQLEKKDKKKPRPLDLFISICNCFSWGTKQVTKHRRGNLVEGKQKDLGGRMVQRLAHGLVVVQFFVLSGLVWLQTSHFSCVFCPF